VTLISAGMTAPPATTSALRQVRGLDVLTWSAFGHFAMDAMVTTRHGGVSAGNFASLNLSLTIGDEEARVLENRRRVAAALGAAPGDFVFCEQVHGGVAAVVGRADRGRGSRGHDSTVPGADALVTADPGTVVAVLAADCVPIVLYDPVRHVAGCAHAGWRGTVARAAASAVAAMESLGTRAADVVAGVGPAIAPARYEVGPDVAQAAGQAFGDRAAEVLTPTGGGRWLFDLWTANRIVLREAGVPDTQIHVTDIPTGPDGGGRFFSHRADRPGGRFAAVARLRPRSERGTP
jgi:polyphenol oxidase